MATGTTIPVKYFHSGMQNAPTLSNAFGVLTTLLDAVLVNGFNSKTISSITRDGSIATVTLTTSHAYEVDQVILISGAVEDDYNGEFRILSVLTASNAFTVAVENEPATPSTGSMTVKVAPLNWEIAFTGAGGVTKRAYRSKNVTSNRPFLYVDDSRDPLYNAAYAKRGKVFIAENMADIDTFVGAYAPYDATSPRRGREALSGSGATIVDGWYKWYYARQDSYSSNNETTASNAFNRGWVLVGDDRGFYLMNQHDWYYSARCFYAFTDFETFRPGDAYNTLLAASDAWMNANTAWSSIDGSAYYGPDFGSRGSRANDVTGKLVMRGSLQTGNPIRVAYVSLGTLNGQVITGYSTGVPWPNQPDYSLLLHPVYLQEESVGNIRGRLPGLMWIHNNSPMFDLAKVDNVGGYPNRKFLIVDTCYGSAGTVANTRVAFDITGPWW